MKRKKLSIFEHSLLILIIFSTLIPTSLLAQKESVHYTLSIKDKNEIIVSCDFNLKQPKNDSLSLIFPSDFGGNSNLFYHISNIQSLSEDFKLIPTKNNNEFICKSKANNVTHLSFSYSINVYHAKVLSNNFYEPFSKSTIIHLIGSTLFAYPSTVNENTDFSVNFKDIGRDNPTLYSTNCSFIICDKTFKVKGLKALKESLYIFTDSLPVNINTESVPIFLFIPNIPSKKKYIM